MSVTGTSFETSAGITGGAPTAAAQRTRDRTPHQVTGRGGALPPADAP
jgi:hypothetical protein